MCIQAKIDTEYDRAKVPPYSGNDPALPWQSKSPSVSTPIKQSTKQGGARGVSEVRRGTSSNRFHCPVPRSSSHIGPRQKASETILVGYAGRGVPSFTGSGTKLNPCKVRQML